MSLRGTTPYESSESGDRDIHECPGDGGSHAVCKARSSVVEVASSGFSTGSTMRVDATTVSVRGGSGALNRTDSDLISVA
jgi:hypothetical protein